MASLPLSAASKPCFLVLTESRGSPAGPPLRGRDPQAHLPNAPLVTLDPAANQADLDQAAAAAEPCDTVVVAAFASVAAYRGNVALARRLPGASQSSHR